MPDWLLYLSFYQATNFGKLAALVKRRDLDIYSVLEYFSKFPQRSRK